MSSVNRVGNYNNQYVNKSQKQDANSRFNPTATVPIENALFCKIESLCSKPDSEREQNDVVRLMRVFYQQINFEVNSVGKNWEWFEGASMHKKDYEIIAVFITCCICLATVSVTNDEEKEYTLKEVDGLIVNQPFCIIKIIQKIQILKQVPNIHTARHLGSEEARLLIENCISKARREILKLLKACNSDPQTNLGKLFAIYKFLAKLERVLGNSKMQELYDKKLKEITVPECILDEYYKKLVGNAGVYFIEFSNLKKTRYYSAKAARLSRENISLIERNVEAYEGFRQNLRSIYVQLNKFNNEEEGIACLKKGGVMGLIQLGDYYLSKEKYQEAVGCFSKSLNDKKFVDKVLRRGVECALGEAHYKLGEYDKAIPFLKSAIYNPKTDTLDIKSPSQHGILILLAESYLKTKKFSEARDALTKCVENKKNNLSSKILRQMVLYIGVIYILEENYSEAIKVLVPTIPTIPTMENKFDNASLVGAALLVISYCSLNKFKEASIYLKKVDIIKNQIKSESRAGIKSNRLIGIDVMYQNLKGMLLSAIIATHFTVRANSDQASTKSLRELSTAKVTRTQIKTHNSDCMPSQDNQLDIKHDLLSANTKQITHNSEVEIIDTANTDIIEYCSSEKDVIEKRKDFNVINEDNQDTDNTQQFNYLYIPEKESGIDQIEKIIMHPIPKHLKCLNEIGIIYPVVGLPNCYILIPFTLINNSIINCEQENLFQTARSTADQGIKQINHKKHTVMVNNRVEKSPVSEVKIGGDDYRIILFREDNLFIPRFAGPKTKKSGSNPRDMVNREWTYPDSELVKIINYLRSRDVRYLEHVQAITKNQQS